MFYVNTGTRKNGEMSAYSLFNPNVEAYVPPQISSLSMGSAYRRDGGLNAERNICTLKDRWGNKHGVSRQGDEEAAVLRRSRAVLGEAGLNQRTQFLGRWDSVVALNWVVPFSFFLFLFCFIRALDEIQEVDGELDSDICTTTTGFIPAGVRPGLGEGCFHLAAPSSIGGSSMLMAILKSWRSFDLWVPREPQAPTSPHRLRLAWILHGSPNKAHWSGVIVLHSGSRKGCSRRPR